MYSKKASGMLQELRIAFQKLVRIQLTQEKKQRPSNTSFHHIFKYSFGAAGSAEDPQDHDSSPLRVGEPVAPCKPKLKFGAAVQKFREAVAKHFLSISVQELELVDFGRMNLVQMLNLSKFKHSLINLFDEDKGYAKFSVYNNIGRRYELVAKNVFCNEYLVDFIKKKPRYGEYFKIKTQDFHKGPRPDDDDLAKKETQIEPTEKFQKLEQIFDFQIGKNDFYRVAKDQKLTIKN